MHAGRQRHQPSLPTLHEAAPKEATEKRQVWGKDKREEQCRPDLGPDIVLEYVEDDRIIASLARCRV